MRALDFAAQARYQFRTIADEIIAQGGSNNLRLTQPLLESNFDQLQAFLANKLGLVVYTFSTPADTIQADLTGRPTLGDHLIMSNQNYRNFRLSSNFGN